MREKVGKSRNTVFFQCFVAPEGRKVGSLKRRVRSHLARWEMKKCTPLWREVHFQVKICQNIQNTPGVGPLLEVEMSKSAPRSGPKHISKSKCTKHFSFGALLEVAMSKNCTPLWREAHFEVKMYKAHHVRTTCGCSELVSRGRRKGLCTFSKVSKTWGFCSIAKNDGRRGTGHLKRICKDAFSVAGAVQETFSSELLGGQGADFLRGVAFWSIRSSGLLRWFRVTGTALRMTWHFFVACAVLSTGGLEKSQNALVRGRQRCRQLSIFEGSLAELLRFWCCQVWKMKSRRIASFLTLLSSKIEDVSQNCSFLTLLSSKMKEVSQNCFLFDVVNLEKWRHLAELLRFKACK